MSAGCHSVICWTAHVLGVQPGHLLDLHQGECDDKLGLGSKKQRSARNQRPSSEFEQEKKKPDLQSGQICVSCSGCFFSLLDDHFHVYHRWTENMEFIFYYLTTNNLKLVVCDDSGAWINLVSILKRTRLKMRPKMR